jgi:hypothetical protein
VTDPAASESERPSVSEEAYSYKRLFMPEPYHIVQEIQKYNLPDYRPRMEQFQKSKRKINH